MIIPDYNEGVVDVHLSLEAKDMSLIDEDIAAKAFAHMTGLKPTGKITETSFENVEYTEFKTKSMTIYVACGEIDITDWVTINSSILSKDKISNEVIVRFESVCIGRFSCLEDLMPIIDFLFKYREELFTEDSDIFV